jgi:hypothetical protein
MSLSKFALGTLMRMSALVLVGVAVFSGYCIKKSALDTIGWDWSRGPTYIFSDAYTGNHRVALILGCYGAAASALVLIIWSIRINRSAGSSP